jgi:hypothetical protein
LVSGAQDTYFRLSGSALASNTIKRDLKISVNSKGVLTGINAGAEDHTWDVVGSVLKVAATVATAAVSADHAGPDALRCNDQTRMAVRRRLVILSQIKSLRGTLSDLPGDAKGAKAGAPLLKQVNDLATEYASLTTGDGPLSLQTTGHIKLDPAPAPTKDVPNPEPAKQGTVVLDYAPFEKWFDKDTETPAEGMKSARQTAIDQYFGLTWAAATIEAMPVELVAAGKTLSPCDASMKIPTIKNVKVSVKGVANSAVEDYSGIRSPRWRSGVTQPIFASMWEADKTVRSW